MRNEKVHVELADGVWRMRRNREIRSHQEVIVTGSTEMCSRVQAMLCSGTSLSSVIEGKLTKFQYNMQ